MTDYELACLLSSGGAGLAAFAIFALVCLVLGPPDTWRFSRWRFLGSWSCLFLTMVGFASCGAEDRICELAECHRGSE